MPYFWYRVAAAYALAAVATVSVLRGTGTRPLERTLVIGFEALLAVISAAQPVIEEQAQEEFARLLSSNRPMALIGLTLAGLHLVAVVAERTAARNKLMNSTTESVQARQDGAPEAGAVAHCIGCGCHDFAACSNEQTGVPCHWLRVDRKVGLGVCSECGAHLARWEAGERERPVALNSLRK
jgi:hypothetical protein